MKYNVPLLVYIPQTITAKGSTKKIYPTSPVTIFCSFRTFGGTEKVVNDVVVVEDTATIETWYRPDITADCKIQTIDGKAYEILGTPENLRMEYKTLIFKIRAVKGGV